MIAFSVLCFFSALIAFEGGIAVLKLNRRRSINIVYAVFAFNYVFFCFFYNEYVTAPEQQISLLWNRLLSFPASLNASFMLHFALLLVSENEKLKLKWMLPFIYLPSLLIALMCAIGRVFQGVYLTPWGWEIYSVPGNPWVISSYVLFIGMCLGSFFLVLYRYRNPFSERNKNQIRPIMLSLLGGAVGWTLALSLFFTDSEFLHTMVSNISLIIILTPLTIGVRIAISKYHLMTLTPQRQAAELIRGMDEAVFLIDMNGTVVFRNGLAKRLAERAGACKGNSICDIFLCSESIKEELKNIAEGKSTGESQRVLIRHKDNTGAAYNMILQGIKNELHEFIGALCIVYEEASLLVFQEKYNITPREIDVLSLSVSGLTNKDIAEGLGISQRTVEHHHENIYNKLGINNKLELYNIALRYKIISK